VRNKVWGRRPSTGTVLGSIALFVALGGTALAATGQLVNIADGTNAAYLAKVSSAGALQVAGTAKVNDGSGPLTVDGAVKATPVLPTPITATTDSPSVISGSACTNPNFVLPTGTNIRLTSVVVNFGTGTRATHNPKAALRLTRKTDSGTTAHNYPIPLNVEDGFSAASGSLPLNIVMKPNTYSDAAPGEIYHASMCLNRGTASSSTATAMLTGERSG
jgi:hypothetical protein